MERGASLCEEGSHGEAISLLAQRRLKAEDLRGLTPRARRQLRRVLLQSLLSAPGGENGL